MEALHGTRDAQPGRMDASLAPSETSMAAGPTEQPGSLAVRMVLSLQDDCSVAVQLLIPAASAHTGPVGAPDGQQSARGGPGSAPSQQAAHSRAGAGQQEPAPDASLQHPTEPCPQRQIPPLLAAQETAQQQLPTSPQQAQLGLPHTPHQEAATPAGTHSSVAHGTHPEASGSGSARPAAQPPQASGPFPSAGPSAEPSCPSPRGGAVFGPWHSTPAPPAQHDAGSASGLGPAAQAAATLGALAPGGAGARAGGREPSRPEALADAVFGAFRAFRGRQSSGADADRAGSAGYLASAPASAPASAVEQQGSRAPGADTSRGDVGASDARPVQVRPCSCLSSRVTASACSDCTGRPALHAGRTPSARLCTATLLLSVRSFRPACRSSAAVHRCSCVQRRIRARCSSLCWSRPRSVRQRACPGQHRPSCAQTAVHRPGAFLA